MYMKTYMILFSLVSYQNVAEKIQRRHQTKNKLAEKNGLH